jgi:hypothetical protein
MAEYLETTPDDWGWAAFDALEMQGHLHQRSTKLTYGDAVGRLLAKGREHLRYRRSLRPTLTAAWRP